MENEKVIRQHMERTRESLTEKLETLENKLLGSVQEATTAVRETVSSVKDTMQEGVESVKDAVDIPAHVDRHPWLTVGGAVLGGFVLANLLTREKRLPSRAPTMFPPKLADNTGHENYAPTKADVPASSPGWLAGFEPELQHLKGLALGVTLGTVRELLTKEVPPHLADQLRGIIDGITKKVGGEPIAGSDLPFNQPATAGVEASAPFDSEKPRW